MTDPMTLPHRIEAAEGADRALDYDIAHLTGDHFRNGGKAPAYTASIDAALTLVPSGDDKTAVFWQVGNDGQGGNPADFLARVLVCSGFTSRETKAVAATPALALCAAALRAKESSDGE